MHRLRFAIVTVTFLAVCLSVMGDTATSGTPRKPTSMPVVTVNPQAKAILDRLEVTGKNYRTLRADVVYKVVNATLGDSEQRKGWVFFQQSRLVVGDDNKTTKTPSRFRISFSTLQQGKGAARKNPVDYSYDGRWLVVAKASTKTVTRYQISDTADQGDSMTIGKGPFPIPFGQKTTDVLKYFQCSTRPPSKYDPANSDYIKLVPKLQYKNDFGFTWLQMWIDRKSNLPVKIVTKDKSKNRTTVLFDKIATNLPAEDKLFRIPKPFGWKLIVRRLDKDTDLTP